MSIATNSLYDNILKRNERPHEYFDPLWHELMRIKQVASGIETRFCDNDTLENIDTDKAHKFYAQIRAIRLDLEDLLHSGYSSSVS